MHSRIPCGRIYAFIFADHTKCISEALNRGVHNRPTCASLVPRPLANALTAWNRSCESRWQRALSSAAVRGEFYIGADGRRCSAGDRWLDRSPARFEGSNVFYQPCRAAFGLERPLARAFARTFRRRLCRGSGPSCTEKVCRVIGQWTMAHGRSSPCCAVTNACCSQASRKLDYDLCIANDEKHHPSLPAGHLRRPLNSNGRSRRKLLAISERFALKGVGR